MDMSFLDPDHGASWTNAPYLEALPPIHRRKARKNFTTTNLGKEQHATPKFYIPKYYKNSNESDSFNVLDWCDLQFW